MAVCGQAVFDICIVKGGTFQQVFDLQDSAGAAIDLTGFTLAALAKSVAGGTTIITFVATIEDAVNGQISINLSSAVTAALTFGGLIKYDIKFTTAGGVVEYLIGGNVRLDTPIS